MDLITLVAAAGLFAWLVWRVWPRRPLTVSHVCVDRLLTASLCRSYTDAVYAETERARLALTDRTWWL